MQDDVVKVKVKKSKEDKSTEANEASEVKKLISTRSMTLFAWLFALVCLVGLVVMYNKYRSVSENPAKAQTAQNRAETARVLGKVRQVILVEEKDAPTVARVEDPAKLQKTNAEFYKNVQKGDYLVIFPKRALIYRESVDQLINIAPIINAPSASKNTQPATPTTTSNKR